MSKKIDERISIALSNNVAYDMRREKGNIFIKKNGGSILECIIYNSDQDEWRIYGYRQFGDVIIARL